MTKGPEWTFFQRRHTDFRSFVIINWVIIIRFLNSRIENFFFWGGILEPNVLKKIKFEIRT